MRPRIDPDDVGEAALVVRTDYSDDAAWLTVVALLETEHPLGFRPDNHFVDDPAWAGASAEEVLAAAPRENGVVFLADVATMAPPHPLLALNTVTRDECEDDYEFAYEMSRGREFRVLPAGVSDVAINLLIANTDFPDFAASAQDDPDGWYRGVAAHPRGAAAMAELRDFLRGI
ncbi:DUF6924 domain-containing protein [Actinophytocola glycyrrhizae]|uniref:DUF6924 domain-containing protein n=1 Tax=Actinophytocola glycyrrhizae TaxID=2044873 RepID=A0ABV9RTH9_9PSEU